MLHTKLQHLSQVILKKKILNIFLCISMFHTQDPQRQIHIGPRNFNLNKLGKGLLCNAIYIYQISSLSQVVLLKKIFEYFSMYFNGSNPGPLGWGQFWSRGPHLNKLGHCYTPNFKPMSLSPFYIYRRFC